MSTVPQQTLIKYYTERMIVRLFLGCLWPNLHEIITSRISGQGNRIGPICVCVSVHLSFSTLTVEPFDVET